jgi:ribose transport system ATP-binding protein
MAREPVLALRDMSKSFGAVRALTGASFSLAAGEIHALCGENGAGKSTLMNIVAGILQPDRGDILLDGAKVTIPSPAAAQRLGIGLVHQEIALCQDVSVAENILMAETNARRSPFMNFRDLNARAQRVMDRLAPIAVETKTSRLPISSQQLVEIAKALTLDCRVLVFDEPTAALTESEARRLYAIIRELQSRGISIIYISHRMAEIFALCDRVTVFRDGRHVATELVADMTPEDVVRRMVGRDVTQLYPNKQAPGPLSSAAILSVRSLSDGTRFRNVSFDLREGEILGLGGLIGAGRSEIAQGLCGLRGATTGGIVLRGSILRIGSYADAVREGIVYLSEDRKGSGVFLDLPISHTISALDLAGVTNRFGFLDGQAEARRAGDLARRLGIRMAGLGAPVRSLSGGNQQKVAIAKNLSVRPKVMVMDEPTRGIDVGAKVEIHRLLRDLAGQGVGMIVISSELPELLGLCDRILVIRDGRIAGELDARTMSEEAVIDLASGIDRAAPSLVGADA